MARTVDREGHAVKRNAILDSALRLVYSKGYERTTIQDILADLRISSGAFYHYFESKPAVLDAIIERMRDVSGKALLPILHDPRLSAVQKLQGFFDAIEGLVAAHRATVLDLLGVWYADENAIVRQKVADALIEQRAPLLASIVGQGVREQVFTSAYAQEAGEIVASLLQAMGDTHARLLLSLRQESDAEPLVEKFVDTHAAYADAIERVLGAPTGSLRRVDADAVRAWIAALRGGSLADAQVKSEGNS